MSDLKLYAYDLEDFIKSIVKKHTESDVTIYGRKDEDGNVTLFSPLRYPDKISSLTDSMTLSDYCLINGRMMNSFLGENIICADLMKKKNGAFIVDSFTDTEKLKSIIKGSNLEDYEMYGGNAMELLARIRNSAMPNNEGKVKVVIDHFFKVKSVGTVILGFVLSGTLKKHQTLFLNPPGIQVQVKSIQMNDVDHDEAPAGSRVGIALKNADIEEITRGSLLEEEKTDLLSEITGSVKFHKAIPEEGRKNGEVFVAGHFIYSRGIMEGNKITMDRPVLPWDDYILIKPNSKPRVIGRIERISE
ncbi:MAG: EF-Tu/IF-2/RF-3 family GTPase [Candidatus Thermoplasmatota archaeon]|nr:EF-Tu/IF-2/RF-3 family GTPase [Candidatus Thermoplasmatota archaeon]MCL5888928.1 EF-Tu/IF-2/RF-3 family GTPase [Candidatus Thermoplasmatota archaeon]